LEDAANEEKHMFKRVLYLTLVVWFEYTARTLFVREAKWCT